MILTLLYNLFTPNKSKYRDILPDDIKEKATLLFNSMNNCETWLFLSCILIVLITGISYFTWYNNTVKPWGYHYRKRHWAGWFVIAIIINIISSWVICNITLDMLTLPGTSEFITWYVIGNSCYTIIFYGILSLVWYNWLPTNAYRWWKIGK